MFYCIQSTEQNGTVEAQKLISICTHVINISKLFYLYCLIEGYALYKIAFTDKQFTLTYCICAWYMCFFFLQSIVIASALIRFNTLISLPRSILRDQFLRVQLTSIVLEWHLTFKQKEKNCFYFLFLFSFIQKCLPDNNNRKILVECKHNRLFQYITIDSANHNKAAF